LGGVFAGAIGLTANHASLATTIAMTTKPPTTRSLATRKDMGRITAAAASRTPVPSTGRGRGTIFTCGAE